MGSRTKLSLLIVFVLIFIFNAAGETDDADFTSLMALKAIWQNTPPNWEVQDPCGSGWDGIACDGWRVTKITLSSLNLTGSLSGDIGGLSELQTLDLSYNKGLTGPLPLSIGNLVKLENLILIGCGFTGPIPDTIGSLQQLTTLSLNSNGFNGPIPASIGNLSNLYWLDLADNRLTGSIPVSDAAGPTLGLDMLLDAKHFHFGSNQLSGTIPPQLFSSNMILIHVLFENNQFSGPIPSSLGEVKTLEVVRLDWNLLNGSVPSNLNSLTSVSELYLSNNRLSGLLPNLTGMDRLTYVDVSNNSFSDSSFPPSYSSLQSLTTLVMEKTHLQGQVPVSIATLPNLQTLVLSDNNFNGTLDMSAINSKQLRLINLQDNHIDAFAVRSGGYGFQIILTGNPFCDGSDPDSPYCTVSVNDSVYTTAEHNCVAVACSLGHISSPNCKCAYPYTGTLNFRATTFSDLHNTSYFTSLEKSLMDFFQLYKLAVDSVSVTLINPRKVSSEYLMVKVQVFPSGQDSFNRTGVSVIGNMLSNQTYKPPHSFGPFFFIGDSYGHFLGAAVDKEAPNKSSSVGIIVGAAAGGSVLVVFLFLAGVYALRQKQRAERVTEQSRPFANWDTSKGSGGVPQLKGARSFSFEELKRYTNNFSEANHIGSGGYGKVYKGLLPSGEVVAIKRAQQGSMQGGVEFKTEIELLSRVHHKNVVSLYGFCFEQREQMLIYEYVPNGTLRESLSGSSRISLDWMKRLKVSLGSARGLAYLHELADPPIIHRDIKSNNILLDERLNAKVADFGLSKPMSDSQKDHVTTQVKGTMGYLDPEYYMTQQLTEKSDVYSFGVMMLEVVTARRPIERGRYIVKEVKKAMDKNKDLNNLQQIIDPTIARGTTLHGLDMFVDVAMRCVEESGENRPRMSEVVKEIENIMLLAGFNPNVESASTSESYPSSSETRLHHPYNNPKAFEYEHNGVFPLPR